MRRHDVNALLTCRLFGRFPSMAKLRDPARMDPIVAGYLPPQFPVSFLVEMLNLDGNAEGDVWNQVVSLLAECGRVVFANVTMWSGNHPGSILVSIAAGGDLKPRLFGRKHRGEVIEFATDSATSNGLKIVHRTTETNLVAGPSVTVDPVLFTGGRLSS